MALIEIDNLSLAGRLKNISLSLNSGEILGIIGPNGSGKSSLLNCLAGLQPCDGNVRFDGQTLNERSQQQRAQAIALLPQSCDSAWALSVEAIVALGRIPWNDDDRAAIEDAMQRTGVDKLRQRRVDQLSGGEQARVWLARVFAGQPRLLLADEPIASLDLYYQRSIMDALRQYANEDKAVILVIHDFSLAARYCDRLCLLDNGQLRIFGQTTEVLTEEHLSTVFRVPVHVDLQATPPIITTR